MIFDENNINEALMREISLISRNVRFGRKNGESGEPSHKTGENCGFCGEKSPETREKWGDGGEKCHRHGFRGGIALAILLESGDGGIRQKELGEKLRVNPSSVSELTDRLCEKGFIVRREDPEDKRATLLLLTEAGRERALQFKEERKKALEEGFKNLTEDEKEQLLALLKKLNEK